MVKSELRKTALDSLKSVPSFQRYSIDKKIARELEKLIERIDPKSILFYLPLPLEVDLKKLMKKQRIKGRKILVPKVEKQSFKMVEYRLPLEENSFKISEPKSSNFKYKRVDLLVVPIVAMDRNRRRVGFGKGMYDRFFAGLKSKPIVVFVQRVPIVSKESLCQKYDIKCDYYISSRETKIAGKLK